MQLSSELLQKLKSHVENIENYIIDTNMSQDTAIDMLIANETATSNAKKISNIKKIILNPKLFEIEENRAVNNQLIKEANNSGANQYESTISCKRLNDGFECGSYTRYISNRGCVKCQTTAKLSKKEKEELAQLIINDRSSKTKAIKVERLMNELDLKKSAAYRLIKLHESDSQLYKTTDSTQKKEEDNTEYNHQDDFTIERTEEFHHYHY